MYFYGGVRHATIWLASTRQLFDRAARTLKCVKILACLARKRTNKRTPLKAHWLLDSQTQCAAGIHQVWMKRYFSAQFKLLLPSMMHFNQAWGQAHVLVLGLILRASAFAILESSYWIACIFVSCRHTKTFNSKSSKFGVSCRSLYGYASPDDGKA